MAAPFATFRTPMPWPLIAFSALILVAWITALVWLARGFKRGWLLDDEAPKGVPPKSTFRV